jgi:hypothetical protein
MDRLPWTHQCIFLLAILQMAKYDFELLFYELGIYTVDSAF